MDSSPSGASALQREVKYSGPETRRLSAVVDKALNALSHHRLTSGRLGCRPVTWDTNAVITCAGAGKALRGFT